MIIVLVLWLSVVALLDPVSMTCLQRLCSPNMYLTKQIYVMQHCLCHACQQEMLPTFFFVFFVGKWFNVFGTANIERMHVFGTHAVPVAHIVHRCPGLALLFTRYDCDLCRQ